jgi:tetratricopeptide (TPR) repeat protein
VLYGRAVADPALRSRALLGQIQSLRAIGQYAACAELGESAHVAVGRTATATDFFSYAASCLAEVSDVTTRVQLRSQLRRHLEQLVRDPQAPLLPDDRSDGFGTLIELADGLGDSAGGDRYAEERLKLLDAAVAQSRSPLAAATYDAHRFDCYRRLKRYPAAESMLLASERAFPTDYNPPARLARLYFEMGRLDQALGRIDRALSLANGPRRAVMLELKASIQHGLGQTPAAITSLTSAKALLVPTASAARLASVQKNIEALQKTLEPTAPAADPKAPGRSRERKVAKRDSLQ